MILFDSHNFVTFVALLYSKLVVIHVNYIYQTNKKPLPESNLTHFLLTVVPGFVFCASDNCSRTFFQVLGRGNG